MSTQTINLKKFKETSSNLETFIKEHEGEISHSQMLQFLSQSMFSKPYEEVKETLLKEEDNVKVSFFYHKDDYFIFINQKCVKHLQGKKPDCVKVLNIINSNKKTKKWNKNIHWIELPYWDKNLKSTVDLDDYEVTISGIKNVAIQFGYLKDFQFINELSNSYACYIDDIHCNIMLNGDWENEILSSEEGEDICIWYPETIVNHKFFEWFFTLKDISEARYNEKENVWVCNSHIIKLLKNS